MSFFRSLLFALLSLMLGGWAPAQVSPAKKSDAFLFTARAFGDDLFEGFCYRDADGEIRELIFDPRYRTPVQALSPNAKDASFFRVVKDARGREREEVVAVADLRSVHSRALLVFLSRRDQARGLPYTVLVADESPGKFEPGQLRFLNLTGSPLMARVGDKVITLGFGFGEDLRFDPGLRDELPFEFAVKAEERWRIIYSTGYRVHPEIGTLAILKPPLGSDSLRIQVELRRQRVYPEAAPETE